MQDKPIHWASGQIHWDRLERDVIQRLDELAQALVYEREWMVRRLRRHLQDQLSWLMSDQEMLMEGHCYHKPGLRARHLRQHRYFQNWLRAVDMSTLPSQVHSVRSWWIESHVAHLDRQLFLEVGRAPEQHHVLSA